MSRSVLLLSNRYTDDSQALWRTASAEGWLVTRLSLADLAAGLPHVLPDAVYGETLFVEALRQSRRDLVLKELSPTWLTALPEEFLGRPVWKSTLQLVRELHLGADLFVKPLVDKQFEARVYRPADEQVAPHVDSSAFVLASEPVSFSVEARVFALPDKSGLSRVVASSTYFRDGARVEEPLEGQELVEVRTLVEAASAIGCVPVPTVLDVGLLRGRWVFIEANPAWGSALYACDPTAVLGVLRAACGKPSAVSRQP